jgi:hypothetical protein
MNATADREPAAAILPLYLDGELDAGECTAFEPRPLN